MFYDNFEKLCKRAGTNPSAVAVEIGIGKSTPASWKLNGTVPKEKHLHKLATALDCEVCDFFREDIEETKAGVVISKKEKLHESSTAERLDDNIAEIVRIYNACAPRQRHQLMSTIYDFEDKVLNVKEGK